MIRKIKSYLLCAKFMIRRERVWILIHLQSQIFPLNPRTSGHGPQECKMLTSNASEISKEKCHQALPQHEKERLNWPNQKKRKKKLKSQPISQYKEIRYVFWKPNQTKWKTSVANTQLIFMERNTIKKINSVAQTGLHTFANVGDTGLKLWSVTVSFFTLLTPPLWVGFILCGERVSGAWYLLKFLSTNSACVKTYFPPSNWTESHYRALHRRELLPGSWITHCTLETPAPNWLQMRAENILTLCLFVWKSAKRFPFESYSIRSKCYPAKSIPDQYEWGRKLGETTH